MDVALGSMALVMPDKVGVVPLNPGVGERYVIVTAPWAVLIGNTDELVPGASSSGGRTTGGRLTMELLVLGAGVVSVGYGARTGPSGDEVGMRLSSIDELGVRLFGSRVGAVTSQAWR
jgi:hypothetical protein